MRTSILIVDYQRIVREGIRGILEQQVDFEVVAESADGHDGVVRAGEQKPHVALVETHLPRHCGIDTIRRIRAVSPGTRCIALSGHQSATYVSEALLAGAAGFVPKHSTGKELVEAVRAVRSGRSYLAAAVADQIVGVIEAGTRGDRGKGGITRRQRQVLQLIADGCTAREIAAELGISVKTAQTHRAKLMNKVGVHKTSGLVRYAVREGIVAA